MKFAVWIFAVVCLLVGAGALLIHTRQTPLPPSEREEEKSNGPQENPSAKPVLSTEQFRILGAEVMKSLPTMDSPDPRGNHSNAVLEAGQRLRAILEAAEDPALEAEAFLLFEGCSSSLHLTDGVRALCYFHYRSLGTRLGKTWNHKIVNAEIRKLSEQLSK